MTEQLTCRLCGAIGEDVQTGLAWYRDNRGIRDVDRCIDHVACRSRVEAHGDSWPLRRFEQPPAVSS